MSTRVRQMATVNKYITKFSSSTLPMVLAQRKQRAGGADDGSRGTVGRRLREQWVDGWGRTTGARRRTPGRSSPAAGREQRPLATTNRGDGGESHDERERERKAPMVSDGQ